MVVFWRPVCTPKVVMRGTYSAPSGASLTARSRARQDGPMTTSIAPANGIEIGYETLGDPGDEPLLLVMGLGAQLDRLAHRALRGARRPRVLRHPLRQPRHRAVDPVPEHVGGDLMTRRSLRAFQGEPVEGAYTLSDMAADGMALLDHLGIDSAHVVGASMGGMIAQTMAIEHPARVRTLTSIMSMTGEPEYGQPTPEALAILAPAGGRHPRGGHRGGRRRDRR